MCCILDYRPNTIVEVQFKAFRKLQYSTEHYFVRRVLLRVSGTALKPWNLDEKYDSRMKAQCAQPEFRIL